MTRSLDTPDHEIPEFYLDLEYMLGCTNMGRLYERWHVPSTAVVKPYLHTPLAPPVCAAMLQQHLKAM